jgi:hypothetical protein
VKRVLIFLFIASALTLNAAPKRSFSPIISAGTDGHLAYDADTNGNCVPDFSTAGYANNDKEIPDAPVQVVVSPISGDETARIQKAIDYVGSLPADSTGIRGAILLQKGRHEIFGQLQITNSGIVLRGEGTNTNGTILVAAGVDRRTLIRISGQNNVSSKSNPDWQITNNYVPVGATSFRLKDASHLKVGDAIFITRPSTKEWIDSIDMTDFGGGLNDWRLVWHPGNYNLIWDRVIQKIDGNTITINSSITTAIETKFGGGFVEAYSWPGRIDNVGIENLRLESTFDLRNRNDENHSWFAVTLESCANAWVRQVTFEHFAGSAVAIYETCKNISVEDCRSLAPISEGAGWRQNTFFTMGQQCLFLRCHTEYGRHDFAVGHCAAGPNAFVDCEADLPTADSGPIESWASGTLFDNVRIDGNGLSLINRGSDGEGAGWSAANSVLWNCTAAKISCENPPDAQNWAFGSWGEFEGHGIWRHSNETVDPPSLFTAQLTDRLGKASANTILWDTKIANEPENAKLVGQIPDAPSEIHGPKSKISLTNGWLVCDGKLFFGGVQPINWWKGNLIPGDVETYGVNLTRFAPGRIGAGFTDDLNGIADGMTARDLVALDYHYGLWYDRRREDHERVRRMTGDVWPPFYEQPFARSGVGKAWDGLSKYDLTKFNTWYWSRLKNFANICDERCLLLFNENYFQHNILEDGAHWVDCPWRPQNNINDTGFHESPFEVEKRIMIAPQFYDVSDPTRRALHARYIQQCLSNFTNDANVIQVTSAEFTGPLAFERFWLDTIADWEKKTKNRPLIALCVTKDVQDSILADKRRAAIANAILFRYWWQTDKGLFAPESGQNKSPRQFERQWKGGAPTDENLAAMTTEYRRKYPDKAILASGEDVAFHGAWAFLCAGGSMPDLPKTIDQSLIAAIPKMQPWIADQKKRTWALREPGKQMLIYTGENSELDSSAETGAFHLCQINMTTGETRSETQTIRLGGKISLDAGVYWLTRE